MPVFINREHQTMSIRIKVLLIILISFIILSIISHFTYQWFIFQDVIIIEKRYVKDDISRVLTIINDDIAEINAILEDWALWNDTYNFIITKNQDYIDSNLPNITFINLNIEFMVFLDTSNRVVFAKRVEPASGREVPIPSHWARLWASDSPLVGHTDPNDRVGGIVVLPEGPFLIASRPIATSTGEGPTRGTLIMGRYLDDAEVARLAHKAGLSLRVFPFAAENVPNDVARARADWPGGERVQVIPRGENLVSGYAVVNDIYGYPALIIRTDSAREAWTQARLSLRALTVAVFGTGLGMALITLALLEGTVLRRLTRLGRAIARIAEEGTVSSRVPIRGNDELTALARGVNTMLASLEQAQSHLQASEERYRYISELISDYAYAFRVEEGNRLVHEWVTDSFTRITGYTPPEVDALGGWRALVHPDDMPIALARAERLFAGQTDVSEFRIVRKDGEVRWLRDHGRPIWDDEAGRVVRIYGAAQDITALRQAEAQIRYEAFVLENVSDAVVSFDAQGVVHSWNRAAEDMFGYTAAEAIGRPADSLVTFTYLEPGRERAFDHLQKTGRSTAEVRITTGKGKILETVVSVSLLRDENGQPTGYVALVHDVTEQRRTEAALRASEERYRSLFEAVPEIVYALTPDGRFTLLNPAFAKITGWSVEAWLGRPFLDLIHPDDRELAWNEFQRALRDETNEFRPLRVLNADGETLILEVLGVAQKQDGQIVGVTGFAHDVTRRVQAEEATRRHVRELEAVHRVSTALRAAQTLDEALGILLDETLTLLNSETGIIRLYHPAAHELRKAVARGWFAQAGDLPLQPGEGIVGRVFMTGNLYVTDDIAADPLILPAFRAHIPAAWRAAAVPIRSTTTTEGVLLVGVPAPRRFTADELRLLEALAEMAGATVHRLRLHDETLRRIRQLEALQTIDRAITASLDLRVSLAILLEQTAIQLGVDAAGVLLYHPHLNTLDYAAGHGLHSPLYRQTQVRLGEGLTGLAALEHRLVVVPDLAQADPPWGRDALREAEGFVSYAVAPLVAKGQLQGVLEVFHRSPLQPDEDWLNFFQALAQQASIAVDNARLFDRLQRSHTELVMAYDATIEGWARALDLRDRETEDHTRRVTEMTLALARAIGMDEAELVHVRRGAILHDIGKMAVPDAILLKPGPLTEAEWVIMRRHPEYALQMLSPIAYLRPALDIPYCHHERWDGSGYPRGLKGEAIPLAARLFAVADVFDALTSDRPYRPAWSRREALDYIRQQAGRQFDPKVVALFLQMMEKGENR